MKYIEFEQENFETMQYTDEEKKKIVKYMLGGEITGIAPGFGRDMDGNSTHIRIELHTDGVFEWRNDMSYYVEHYNMALPKDFLEKILKS